MNLAPVKVKEYRADIDGLRAIAVLSVLVHHISSSLLPGGFVGVDIFFVISGYLITSHIYGEMQAGSFTFRNFYKRRINRIVPALAFVVAFSAIFAVWILSPSDLKKFGMAAALSIVGFSNIFIWREYGDYFAADASEAVLLHTWTLGVEEQFYLIWPLVLYAIFRTGPRKTLGILVGLTVVGVAASQYGATHFPKAAYYLLPTRLFELLIGCTLAISTAVRARPPGNYGKLGELSGYALIAVALFGLSRDSTFPGLNALPPCVGSALLLWSGADGSPRLRSARAPVFIGKISYSLYLWHWPIIAYVNYLAIPIDLPVGLAIAAASVMLAWLSWRFIETPFRSSGVALSFAQVFTRRLLAPATAFAAMAGACIAFNGFPGRYDPMIQRFEAMAAEKPNELRRMCHSTIAQYEREPNPECRLGAAKAEIDGILIGDSYANHFTAMIDELAKVDGVTILDYTMDGCLPIFGYLPGIRQDYAERCALRNDNVSRLLKQRRFTYVILAADWPLDESAAPAIDRTVAEIIESGARPIVILGNQRMAQAATCPMRQIMFGLKKSCAGRQTDAPAYWGRVQARHSEVRFVDPNEVICADRSCSPVLGDTLLYRDDGHLNAFGSRLIGKTLSERGRSLTAR